MVCALIFVAALFMFAVWFATQTVERPFLAPEARLPDEQGPIHVLDRI